MKANRFDPFFLLLSAEQCIQQKNSKQYNKTLTISKAIHANNILL